MKTKIITSLFIILVLCITIIFALCLSQEAAGKDVENYSKEELIELINEQQIIKDNAHNMASSARILGWKDNNNLIKELQSRWNEADIQQKKYQALLNEIEINEKDIEEQNRVQMEEAKWAIKAAEYPVATQIWRYMKEQGWNDYVCAGIMGNIMAEVGGQTLNIRYTLSSGNYYGMCQWSRSYSKVWGSGLETQCDFLRDTIKYEFDTYGNKYQKGFNFNSFLNMTDA